MRRGGEVLEAKVGAWKAQWKACAGRVQVEKSGVCEMPEYACRCPNCAEMAEIIVRAAALRGEYAVSGEVLDYRESLRRASPDALGAAASSPWAAPLDMITRREDVPEKMLTEIEEWLDSAPIRWQAERITEYPKHGERSNDGPRRNQESERRPEGARSVA